MKQRIEAMLKDMRKHFGKSDGGGSNYFIDEYVLDELSGWITVKLTELLSNAEGEVKEFDEDVVIIYMQNKPHGIRNKNGFLLFFPTITKYDGQEDRYGQEVQEQIDLATKILHCIASQPTSKGESA